MPGVAPRAVPADRQNFEMNMNTVNRNNFWNDAAVCGALLGALLGVSYLIETGVVLWGRPEILWLLTVEWIALFALHLWLIYRFVRRRSTLFAPEEGFSFGQGYGYIVAMSGFAGFLVGIVEAIFQRIVGYETYVERMIDVMGALVGRGGGLPASMEGIFSQSVQMLRNTPAPSLLDTVCGGVFSGLLFGAFFGLIIAGVCARSPRPFETGTDE